VQIESAKTLYYYINTAKML